MTLRAKLLALFAILGVAPVVALGVFNYIRSIHAVEDLIASRTTEIAERAAAEIADRYALRQSELLLLAENAETQRLFGAHQAGGTEAAQAAYEAADAYLRQAWRVVGAAYQWVEFRDTAGAVVHSLGADRFERSGEEEFGMAESQDVIRVVEPIRDIESGRALGTLVAAVRTRTLLSEDALGVSFGDAGYSVVLDRTSGRVLYHPHRAFLRQSANLLLGPEGWDQDTAVFQAEGGRFQFEEAGEQRVASFTSLSSPAWTIVSSASVAEFAPPFARTRTVNLVVMLLVAAVISVAFLLTTRRMTRSLRSLTAAKVTR